MRVYRVNGIEHKVFEPGDVIPGYATPIQNWRDAIVGDWVKADDGCILQVLRRGSMLKAKGKVKQAFYVGTCTGTFPTSGTGKMDTNRRDNIYSFGGKTEEDSVMGRDNLTSHEAIFIQYIIAGMDPKDAYLKAYKTKSPGYAGLKAGRLLKTERVMSQMKKELEPVMETLGLDESFVLRNIKEVIENTEKDDTKLKALFKLSDIMDMEDKTKTNVTQISGAVFQGFSDNLLGEVERPKEIDNGSK